MSHNELTFIRKTLDKARKLGFERSVTVLTRLLEASGSTDLKATETARRSGKAGTSRKLSDYKFASVENAVVTALAARGIVTRVDLVNALAENGRKRNSTDVDLARLLNQESLSVDIARPSNNTAKAIYRLANLPLSLAQKPDDRPATVGSNLQPVANLRIPVESAPHRVKKGPRSKPLSEFPFAQQDAPLVAALAKAGIVSRSDLVKALVATGRRRVSVEAELVRLLRTESLSPFVVQGRNNLVRSIHEIAGLPLAAPSGSTATGLSFAPGTTGGMPRGLKSRLLSSFPFAYNAQALIAALAARGIHTRADLLRIMKKRKLEVSGVAKFLDGQLTTMRGVSEGYSVTAQMIAGIARLPCHDAYGSKQPIGGNRQPIIFYKEETTPATGNIEAAPVGSPDVRYFADRRLDLLAPGLTRALAKAGLTTETKLRDELVKAGVSKGKAADAVGNLLNGSLLGTIRHQAGSTSVGRFFCDRAGISFAKTLDEISNPLPAISPSAEQDMACGKALHAEIPAVESLSALVRVTAEGAVSINSFDQGLLGAMPKLMRQALALTRNKASSEDLVQTTLLQALAAQRERQGFQPQPGEAYQQSLERWLCTIQRNSFISSLRKARKHQHVSLTVEDGEPEILNYLPVPERQENIIELQNLLTKVADLPVEQRDALMQVSLHGDSYEDVANASGVALGTAKSRVFRARNALGAGIDRVRNHNKMPNLRL